MYRFIRNLRLLSYISCDLLHNTWRQNYGTLRVGKDCRVDELSTSTRPKPGPHQQHCRSNIVECYKVECCFDCCRFWQQCRRNVRHCCQKRRQCRTSFALKFRPFDKVEWCFDIVAQNGNIVEATGNKVASCFDNVASTLLLVWTGLYTTREHGLCARMSKLTARVHG